MPRRRGRGYIPPLHNIIKSWIRAMEFAAETGRFPAAISDIFGVAATELKGEAIEHWVELFKKEENRVRLAIRWALNYARKMYHYDTEKVIAKVKEAFTELIKAGVIKKEVYNAMCEKEGIPALKVE